MTKTGNDPEQVVKYFEDNLGNTITIYFANNIKLSNVWRSLRTHFCSILNKQIVLALVKNEEWVNKQVTCF